MAVMKRVARAVAGQPLLSSVLVQAATQVNAWQRHLEIMRASPSKLLHLTEKQFIIAETTIELVVMDHRQPSRAEIVEAVRGKDYTCCEETVRRTHNQLRDAGLMSWKQQYDIGWRVTSRGGRVRQARQTVNDYQFHLPQHVGFILPEARGRGQRKPRRLHSCDRPPRVSPSEIPPGLNGQAPKRGFDPQMAGVKPNNRVFSLPLSSSSSIEACDLLRRRQIVVESRLRQQQAMRALEAHHLPSRPAPDEARHDRRS